MNKYQKQAIFDLAKVAGYVIAGLLLIGGLVKLGMSVPDLVGSISLVVLGYSVYQLYLIRVGQLEAEDKTSAVDQ